MKIFYILPFLLTVLQGEKIIVVDLSKQMVFAKEGSKIIMKGMISSGKPGYETPNGTFVVSEKEIEHKSTLYPKPNGGGAMDYMMRLSGSSYALHLGNTPGYPASHGCVRLEYDIAMKMYRWATVGTKVFIRGKASAFKGRTKEEAMHNIIIDEELYPGDMALNRLNAENDEIY